MTNTALLCVNDACKMLGVSRTTLYKIVNEYGQLKIAHVARLGKQRRMYFHRSDVLALKRLRKPTE